MQQNCVWLVFAMSTANLSLAEKCFQCGDDKLPGCMKRMSLSLSDMNADTICASLGSCVKYNLTAVIPPGNSHRDYGLHSRDPESRDPGFFANLVISRVE